MRSGAETWDDVPVTTRDHLLQAVIDIAGEHGRQAVTHRSVAARAEVTHGLVRHYFGTREAMIAQALERAIQSDITHVALSTDAVETFGEGLVDAPEQTWRRRVLQFEVVLDAIRGTGDPALAEALYARYEEQVSETFENLGVDDPDGGWRVLVFAALDGLALQHGLFRDVGRTESALRHLRELVAALAQPDTA